MQAGQRPGKTNAFLADPAVLLPPAVSNLWPRAEELKAFYFLDTEDAAVQRRTFYGHQRDYLLALVYADSVLSGAKNVRMVGSWQLSTFTGA